MVREKYPSSYQDCGENSNEQCPKNYPGAKVGSDEYNEVMKLTSAVKWFGKSTLKKIRERLDKGTGGRHNGEECNAGYYAEAAASKRSADIVTDGKRYNCKGGGCSMPPLHCVTLPFFRAVPTAHAFACISATLLPHTTRHAALRTSRPRTHTESHTLQFLRRRVSALPFERVPGGLPGQAAHEGQAGGRLRAVREVRGVAGAGQLRRRSGEGRPGGG